MTMQKHHRTTRKGNALSPLALPLLSAALLAPLAGCGGVRNSAPMANVSPTGAAVSRAVSPTSFVFSAKDANGIYQICTMPDSGGTATQITFGGLDKYSPSWSPKVNKIAYVSPDPPLPTSGSGFGPDGDMGQQIYTIPANGGTPTKITNGSTYKYHPTWSPDGTKIAYAGKDPATPNNNFNQIWTIPSGGGIPKKITTTDTDKSLPTWSPVGPQIAYRDISMIYVMGDTGVAPRQIADNGDSIAWSPDGLKIAFTQYYCQLFTVPYTGGTITAVTPLDPNYSLFNPAWSPDGSKIAYIHSDANGSQIWKVPAVGGTPVRLTSGGPDKSGLFWCPPPAPPSGGLGGG